MSEQPPQLTVDRLVDLVFDLNAELRQLTITVGQLEQRQADFEVEIGERLAALESGPEQALGAGPVQASRAGPEQASGLLRSSAALSPSGVPPHRPRACESIGAWIRRCLAGTNRGKSGRDQIELPSQFYLVVRDKENQLFDPPRVYRSWAATKPVVSSRGSVAACAIFVGLPSQAEVRLCCRAAGLEEPTALQ